MESKVPNLPEELIFQEILPRLPAKSLVRFKSVSISWNSLIFNPHFLKLHLKQSVDHNLSWFIFSNDHCHPTLGYEAPPHGTSETDRPRQFCESSDEVDLVASCNGLFCISNGEDDLFLWNPSIRETRMIPSSTIEFPVSDSDSPTRALVFFGLGHHSDINDYKLVRICMFDSEELQTEVKVYSRNTNAWKRIGDFPYDYPFGRPGVFVSGCLHWIVSMWENGVKVCKISALNVAKESYKLIQPPEFGREKSYFDFGTSEENLVLFCSKTWNCNAEIWILKEYGKAESWTRIKIAIDCIPNYEDYLFFQPLCFLKPAGEMLLRIGDNKVCSFDLKENKYNNVLTSYMFYSRIDCFVESLVSPNAH